MKNVFVNVNNPNFTSQAITFWINHWDAYFHVHSNQFSVEANNMATHQFMWNEWVAWLCKLNRFETLNEQIFSLWDAEWQTRMEPFISHQINCSQETCPEMYQNLLPLWRTNEELMITAWEGLGYTNNYNLRRNTYVKGSRHYELSNHLGNVLTVVSDRKIEHDERYAFAQGGGYKYENGAYHLDASGSFAQLSASDGIISHYTAELISATDYYAFGAPLPGRTWQGGEYRFGFNGKENDNEVNGNGGQQDYGMRIYDNRLGRFLSLDPLSPSFPFYSPFQFAGNTPIMAIDLDGLETQVAIDGKTKKEGPWDMTVVNQNLQVQMNINISRALGSSVPVPKPPKSNSSPSSQSDISKLPNKTEMPIHKTAIKPEKNSINESTSIIGLGSDFLKNEFINSKFDAFGLRTAKGYPMTEVRNGFAYRNGEEVIFKTDAIKGVKVFSYGLTSVGVFADYANYYSGATNGGEFSYGLLKTGIGLINLEANITLLLIDQTKIGKELNLLSRDIGIRYQEMINEKNKNKYKGGIKPATLRPAP